jgi:hypothetical protein
MKNTKQIAFTADKNGTPIAYYLLRAGFTTRWIKMGYDKAKIEVATGTAIQVEYVKWS